MSTTPAQISPGEPAFHVTITAHAWTQKQAESIAKQVAMILAGYDVQVVTTQISSDTAAQEAVSSVTRAPAAEAPGPTIVTGASVSAGVRELEISRTEVAAKEPESEPARPFAAGDVLADLNVPERTVTVTSVDEKGFSYDGGSCPWASAHYYEKVTAAPAEPDPLRFPHRQKKSKS